MQNLAITDPPVLAVAHAKQATATLADFYERMALIRATERALLDLSARGKLRGTVHACIGQEAIAVGVVSALDLAIDAVLSDHRGHGHFLAYRDDVRGLIAEVLGRPEGVCGGVGGSPHLHVGNFHANGIPGGMAPAAAGIATAMKRRNQRAIAVLFHGDTTIAEALDIAALGRVPLLQVIERNQAARSTKTALETVGGPARRGTPCGIPNIAIDGNDVMAVYDAAACAVAAIRAGNGPRILVCDTHRLDPRSEGDDHRDPAAFAGAARRDPLIVAEAGLDAAWCRDTRAAIEAEVAATVAELAAC